MDLAGAAKYSSNRLLSVPGWFKPTDAAIFIELSRLQSEFEMSGDILEVGSYMGRSAILLGYLLKRNERLVVCDVFGAPGTSNASDAENARFYSDLSQQAFEKQYLKFHHGLPTVISGPSVLLRDLPEETFRFIHIDGSHTYEDVQHDVDLAIRLAKPREAIIALDDVGSAHVPGVAAAVWPAVVDGRLVPLILTNKLYCSVKGAPSFIESFGAMLKDVIGLATEEHQIAGHRVLRILGMSSRQRRLWNMAPSSIQRLGWRMRQRLR